VFVCCFVSSVCFVRYNNPLSIDGSAIEKKGFKYAHPQLTKEDFLEVMAYFQKQGFVAVLFFVFKLFLLFFIRSFPKRRKVKDQVQRKIKESIEKTERATTDTIH
jgi:hypothetical protein